MLAGATFESFEKADSAKGIGDVSANSVIQSSWRETEGCIFETRLTGESGKLVERLIKNFPTLETVARASLGCQAYNSSKHTKEQSKTGYFMPATKRGKDYLP